MAFKRIRPILFPFLIALLVTASLLFTGPGATLPAQAESETSTPATASTPQPGPNRKKTLTVNYTQYNWWISNWQTNEVVCALAVEHDGTPSAAEIQHWCEASAYTQWQNTRPCQELNSGGNLQLCTGVYLHLIGTEEKQREVVVDLQPATAWIALTHCNPASPTSNSCSTQPNLLITGEEPLPNETIISIQGTFRGEAFSCMGASCEIPLPATGTQGEMVEFWADSSFGDSSPHYTAKVRMIPWGDFVSPDENSGDPSIWYADVLSSQWKGSPTASCSQTWESFPDLGGPPNWLDSPNTLTALASSEPYYYLAGALIQSGKVDANDCPDGGLDASGVANACGLERSRPAVNEWQNQFDQEILDAAHETGVPAQLMKNIFSRESQFWPGIFRTYREAGLGQLTDNGADTVLLWNPSFFDQFCPLVFSKDVCKKGFSELDSAEREMLSGALVNKVNAACPDCPAGIDLSQATFSVNVFAQTLLANCEQAGQVIYNATGKAAGLSSSFIDLWKFTLINYNAGAGCLENAVKQTQKDGRALNWENVSAHLEEFCQGAISYVNDIAALGPLEAATPTVPIPLLVTQVPQTPEVVPTLAPTNAPTPSAQSATPTSQPPAENTPTATPTHSYGYPEPTAGPPIYPYP